MAINRSINPWTSSLPDPSLVPQYRGEWTSTPYEAADVVDYLGGLFISNAPTKASDLPGTSTKWTSIVSPTTLNEFVDLANTLNATVSLRLEVPYTGKTADSLPSAFPTGLSVMSDLSVQDGIPSKFPGNTAGSLINFSTPNPDGTMQLYKEWRTNELHVRGYHADTQEWRGWSRIAHSGNIAASFCLTTENENYKIDKTGLVDCTAELNKLFSDAYNKKLSVYLNPGRYLIKGTVNVPLGLDVLGQAPGVDDPGKGVGGDHLDGTVLLMRDNAQFVMEGGSSFEGCTIYYDQQNYHITVDNTQPDGYSPFKSYKPTFLLVGTYNGCRISNILYLGGSDFAAQQKNTSNPEKFSVSHVYGWCSNTFITVHYVSDIPQLNDIFLNPNSVGNFPGSQELLNNLTSKSAKNVVALKLARIDGFNCYRVFVFGVKTFVEFFKSDDIRDDETGSGIELVNSSADTVAYAFDINRSNVNGFCIKTTNSSFIPIVYNWIEGNVVVPDGATPAVLRLRPNVHDVSLMFTGVNIFGSSGNPVVPTSRARYLDMQSDGGNANVTVQLTNYRSNGASIFCNPDAWLFDHDPGTLPIIQNNGMIFNNKHIPNVVDLTGSFLGTPTNGQSIGLFIAPYKGKLVAGQGVGLVRTATSGNGNVFLEVGSRRLGNFYFKSGNTTSDPIFTTGATPTFEKGDLIHMFADGLAGGSNFAWTVPMQPVF